VKNIKRAVICLDGEPPSKKTFQKTVQDRDFVIAADGGANWLYEYGIKPDLLIGDLDGVQEEIRNKLPEDRIIQKVDQYSTDFEKAFTWVTQKKIENVVVFAMAGKRIDHLLSNFSLVWKFHKKANIEIVHDGWNAHLLPNQKQKYKVRKGMTISLIPFSDCAGITLAGFEYPLQNAVMNQGNVGVSNVATESQVMIEVKKGRMIAIFMKEKK
jgi:thiamine pyrophosphokinase